MAKQTRPFSGHYDADDPRFSITAAGGCTWPTTPAFRYLCVSDDASGQWSFLNYAGFLIQQSSGAREHDEMTWIGQTLQWPLLWAVFFREFIQQRNVIEWTVQIHSVYCYFPAFIEFEQVPGPGNLVVPLRKMSCTGADGDTGDEMRLLPVQFDQTRPPGGFPPP